MGQDGLAPRSLSRLHPRYATPHLAVAVLASWSILLVLAVGFLTTVGVPVLRIGSLSLDLNLPEGKPPFDVITDFAMFGAISFETLAVASIFVFRRRFPTTTVHLPYRCPLYPVLPAVYVLALGTVLVNMFQSQRAEAMTGVGFILVGAVVYLAVGRRTAATASGAP
jgi:amino acid transporter